jgi:hypothetical protein
MFGAAVLRGFLVNTRCIHSDVIHHQLKVTFRCSCENTAFACNPSGCSGLKINMNWGVEVIKAQRVASKHEAYYRVYRGGDRGSGRDRRSMIKSMIRSRGRSNVERVGVCNGVCVHFIMDLMQQHEQEASAFACHPSPLRHGRRQKHARNTRRRWSNKQQVDRSCGFKTETWS